MFSLPLRFAMLVTALSTGIFAADFSGRVDAEDGKPVEDADVTIPAINRHLHTDAAGIFKFTDLPRGVFAVKITKEGLPSRVVTIDLRNENVELKIRLDYVQLKQDTIIISGYRPADEAEIAQAVTVIEGKKLDRLRGQSLVQTVEDTPGVANFSTGNSIAKPVIRGLPSFRSLVLVDGMREESQQFGDEHGPNIDILDMDRIEIVRGPGSLLYGSDALGGVINVTTPELPRSAEHAKTLSGKVIGNANSNNPGGAGAISLAGAKNDFGYRGNFSYRQAGNTLTPAGAIPNSAYENLNGSGLIGINEKWGMLSLRFSRYDTKLNLPQATNDAAGKLIADPGATTYQRVAHNRLQLKSLIQTSIAKFDIGLTYQQNQRREFEDNINPDPRLNLLLDTFNSEIKAHHAPLGPLLGTIGLSYIYQKNQTLGSEPLIPGYTANSYGAYLFEELRFDAFSIMAGVRGDTRVLSVQQNAQLGNNNETVQNSAMTGSVGAVWRFAPGWSLFANLGRGFRAPTIFELYSTGVHEGAGTYDIGKNDLKSETSVTTDSGIRVRKGKVRAELNGYYNRIDNYVFAVPTGNIQNVDGNAYPEYQTTQGRATIYGGEADGEFAPLKWLTLSAGVDLIYGRNETLGEPLALIPANRYRTGITFSGDKLGSILNPYISLKARYVARKTEISAAERTLYPGFADYTLVSLSTGGDFAVGGQMWTYTIGADNLLNQRYVDYLSRQKLFALNPGVNVYFKITAPFDLVD
ncbi:TonB-dependent receptor [Turneriella parva]|uniref:TonB-dependent receptor n=1 Tax=Turneriella parva (strain ATCC BAA-1111 / DSM 21527 / NCTC 11395 / H) TaxID=869212 RepID=I4B1B3_TURPD|nr:TonB-dependent receptor [Turneriella parva]AFM11070.1 TonB-dependent receptor [Turneriella parva DSM 21527]